ncbi:MAG TPA: sigma-70 family RNA polymerase sigma factor [Pyrinomonadaceae bacterium]|jgi:RNA polymerase sigma factor (sigma-70 family)|nr:sigma-70 family RNA polymerase sigma factor [Pyrinomonadaceae bacterium]
MYDSDLQLVLACRRGDQLAWEKLIRRYQRLIYAIPLRAGLDEDQAAEIFQDVFATFFQKLNDIQEPEKLQAWLVTTARRKTWRTIAKSQTLTQDDSEAADSAATVRDETPLPDEQLLILEEQHQIRTAVSMLDERCQKLVQMLFYRGQPPSYAELAAELGIPEGSIGPTRARCLAKLLRILKKLDVHVFSDNR